jgi:hypothetical protein
MKKGTQIWRVVVDESSRVSIMDSDRNPVKVTRSQRNALIDWKNEKFLVNIIKEFSNNKILHPEFTIVQNGEIVFKM